MAFKKMLCLDLESAYCIIESSVTLRVLTGLFCQITDSSFEAWDAFTLWKFWKNIWWLINFQKTI